MTDNVNITPGVGAAVAADNIGSVYYQRVKVTWGPDGTANDADTASGKGLPVQLRDSSGTELATSGNPARIDPTGTTAQPVTDNGGSLTVDNGGTFPVQATQAGTWNVTNISGTISLPTGAATAAKQPALGTAGTASADVLTVQGIASMTALKVDGSAVTQPVTAAPSLKTTSSLTNANVSFSSSGENTVVAGTASQTIRVFRGAFVAAAAVTLTIKNAASGTTLATIPLAANGAFTFDTFDSGEPMFVTASAGAFIVSLSSGVSVTGFVQYTKS